MTEHAHRETGIDIHPGAKIGRGFFIDHGTGVVIGETAVIGNNVKIYQGVTIGARSFELDVNGFPVKGIKRHPNIGDNVIIYANATIIGNITIGKNNIITGNARIMRSIPANPDRIASVCKRV
jgi:serine O-acetyltransferase